MSPETRADLLSLVFVIVRFSNRIVSVMYASTTGGRAIYALVMGDRYAARTMAQRYAAFDFRA